MNSIEYSRRLYLHSLYEPRIYRAGKFTAYGYPKQGRQTLLEIAGPGTLRRLWSTHAKGDQVRLHIHVDDDARPVLSGFLHELAAAAAHVQCTAIPLGGFYDHRSANLYLPIPFARSLRIDAEPVGDPGDGPYWQIDYALGGEEAFPVPRQETGPDGKPVIVYDALPESAAASPAGEMEMLDEDIELRSASPGNLWIEGGGIIREIAISGQALDSLLLRIAFDGERGAEDRLDGPFQVDAPLRYLVGPFSNACVERTGSTAVIRFPMPFRVRAGFQLLTGMDYGSFSESYHFNVRIRYDRIPPPPDAFSHFHAQFRSAVTNGRDDFECCSTRGKGHFVGVHIFDTGHDHGGGDNLMFDAGADTAGQLHGICGEDYFHMAYMRIWNRTPYSGCPSHSARYRHHLEMPIPFHESFVFNWGSFAGQPAKAVAFWYQEANNRPTIAAMRSEAGRAFLPDQTGRNACPICGGHDIYAAKVNTSEASPLCESAGDGRDALYTLTGPFALESLDALKPGAPFPATATPWPGKIEGHPVRSWHKRAQQGFVDLCHVHRRYAWAVPPSTGAIPGGICTCAETQIWSDESRPVVFRLGCDDPVRLYLNGVMTFSDDGRNEPDPFKLFKSPATLKEGINRLRIVVGNTENHNWFWNGFSLTMERKKRRFRVCGGDFVLMNGAG